MRRAIQMLEEARDEKEAQEMLAAFSDQEGYLGGRVLAPSPGKPTWRVQGFVEDEGCRDGWLPDGMRRVMVPDGLARTLGIEG